MPDLSWPFDSATTLALVTTAATIVLAVVGAIALWEGRRQARIDFMLLRLDRLYTPLHGITSASGDLFEPVIVPGSGPSSGTIVVWDHRIAPLMAPNTHLASVKLRALYFGVLSHKKKQTAETAREFVGLVSEEYPKLLRRLRQLTGERSVDA
jgi:hypothetical protein